MGNGTTERARDPRAPVEGPPGPRRRTAVLISGRGSNLAALMRAAADPTYPAEIALVISNRANAPGLGLARNAAIPTAVIEQRGRERAAHEAAIDAALVHHEVEFVCLAGYLRVLTPFLVERWRGRMLNIHPSLLPAFPGLETHARALAAGVKLHGCTVHLVAERVDAGPILVQAAVPVLPTDSAENLAARVLLQEHRIYPLGLAMLAGAAVSGSPPDSALLNPLPAFVPVP
ncbi:MAG: phosphoribosylglycinamide formyltransferase [Acetobacteraceae bacterium]